MKKILIAVMLFILVASCMISCGKSSDTTKESIESTNTTAVNTTTDVTSSDTAASDVTTATTSGTPVTAKPITVDTDEGFGPLIPMTPVNND